MSIIQRGTNGLNDGSEVYKNKGYGLKFFHVPSGKSCSFKAFLDSIDFSWTQNWNADTAYGRMDDIARYSNTTREISVSWKIPATGPGEARNTASEVSKLTQFMYPSYSDDQPLAALIKTPPLLRVKYSNLITRPGGGGGGPARTEGLLCRPDGMNASPVLEAGVFPLRPGHQVPKVWQLSMNLVVLHEDALGWVNGKLRGTSGKKEEGTTRRSFRGFPFNVETFRDGPATTSADDDINPEVERVVSPNSDYQGQLTANEPLP